MVIDGVLHRSWREGRIGGVGFLEDDAAVAIGLFALYAATGEIEWYRAGHRLASGIPERFADAAGGFYDTPIDGEALIKRPKSQADNPVPSGSGMAAEALLMLFAYTGEARWRDSATSTLRSAGILMERYPSMVGHHLGVLHSLLLTGRELAIVGPDWADMARVYWSRYRPGVVLAGSEEGDGEIPLLESRSKPGQTLAYLCQGHVCDLPTDDPGVLAVQLLTRR